MDSFSPIYCHPKSEVSDDVSCRCTIGESRYHINTSQCIQYCNVRSLRARVSYENSTDAFENRPENIGLANRLIPWNLKVDVVFLAMKAQFQVVPSLFLRVVQSVNEVPSAVLRVVRVAHRVK